MWGGRVPKVARDGADVTVRAEPDKVGRRKAGVAALARVLGARLEPLDLDGDAVAADHHGAPGHRQIIGENMDVVVLGGVEFDDGAAAEAEHLVDWHGGGAQHHRDVDRNVVEFRQGVPVSILV
jgi:hypothetical protein